MGHISISSVVSDADPITFDLDGEKFTCLDAVPIGAVLDAGAARLSATEAVIFIGGCLLAEDVDRFMKVIHSKTRIFRTEEIDELLNGLLEEYGDRPTRPSGGSASGRPSEAAGSGDASGSRKLKRKNSTSEDS